MIKPDPWTRINDLYLDGSIKHELPAKDKIHPLMAQYSQIVSKPWRFAYYNKIALDLVAETVFNYPCPCITEKTTRPIVNQRMFIIAGPTGVLALLKDKGFETWSDIIDESYDQILDPSIRLRAILTSVKEFMKIDISTVKQYMDKNKDKLRHNLDNLRNLREKEIKSLLLILDKK